MSIRTLVAFIAMTVVAQVAIGQDVTAATRPSVAVDQTTPRGALKSFFQAEASSDGSVLRDVMLATSPAEEQIVAAIADKKEADRQLTLALLNKFPDPTRPDPQDAAEKRLPEVFDKIDQSDEQINGDTATLKAAGPGGQPFTLKLVGGKWRIPLSVLFENVNPDLLRDQAHQIEIQVDVMRTAAADVKAGKYPSATDAIADVKKRIYDAALADHAATTRGTTQP